jgi:hypothetical protein
VTGAETSKAIFHSLFHAAWKLRRASSLGGCAGASHFAEGLYIRRTTSCTLFSWQHRRSYSPCASKVGTSHQTTLLLMISLLFAPRWP